MMLSTVILAEAILADAGTAASIAISLVLLIAVVVLFVRLQSLENELAALRRGDRKPASPGAPVSAPVSPLAKMPAPVPGPGPADAELVAILAAAAMAYLGRRVAVRRITFINQNTVSGWAEAGRLSIHTSHNVRRN